MNGKDLAADGVMACHLCFCGVFGGPVEDATNLTLCLNYLGKTVRLQQSLGDITRARERLSSLKVGFWNEEGLSIELHFSRETHVFGVS